MMHRCDFDVGFQHAEVPLDVGRGLVTGDLFGGRKVPGIGRKRQFAIERFSIGDRVVVQGQAEALGLQGGLDEPGQVRLVGFLSGGSTLQVDYALTPTRAGLGSGIALQAGSGVSAGRSDGRLGQRPVAHRARMSLRCRVRGMSGRQRARFRVRSAPDQASRPGRGVACRTGSGASRLIDDEGGLRPRPGAPATESDRSLVA